MCGFFLTPCTTVTVKVNDGPVLAVALLTRVRLVKRFTISEVTAEWHELMIPRRTMRPSIAGVREQFDPRFPASRHATAPISHTIHSPRSL